jgi:hypothetical protein
VDRTIDDDVFGADSLPVQPTITVAIRAKRRAIQRDPGKQSARTRIRKNLSPKCDVGAELDLASKNGIGYLLSKECFLAIKPLDEVGDGDAVTFPEARDTNFPGINCRPNLFVVRADETRRLLIEEGLTACPDVPVIS